MILENLKQDGLFIVRPEPNKDERGFFAKIFSSERFKEAGLQTFYPEWSISYNKQKGTLRGLHWQAAPHFETKIITCIRGSIFDVAVDVRTGSPSYGQWTGIELSAENGLFFYLSEGFAHGFQTLTNEAVVMYFVSEKFHPNLARGVIWNDPDLNINWPHTPHRIISPRDRTLPQLSEISNI